jgi:hypothetical protein
LKFKLPYAYNPSPVNPPVLLELSSLSIPEISQLYNAKTLYFTKFGEAWNPQTKTSYTTDLKEKVRLIAAEEIRYLENVVLLDSRLTVSQLEQKVWAKIFDKRLDKIILGPSLRRIRASC